MQFCFVKQNDNTLLVCFVQFHPHPLWRAEYLKWQKSRISQMKEEQNISNEGFCFFYTNLFLIIFSTKMHSSTSSTVSRSSSGIIHSPICSNTINYTGTVILAALKTKLETQNQIHKNMAHFNHEPKATQQKMGAGLYFVNSHDSSIFQHRFQPIWITVNTADMLVGNHKYRNQTTATMQLTWHFLSC